jgi:hypothetical protein
MPRAAGLVEWGTAKSQKSKKFYPLYISYPLYYLFSSIYIIFYNIPSLIHLSILIHPASIRHRSRQAEYRHAAALRARRGSTAAA